MIASMLSVALAAAMPLGTLDQSSADIAEAYRRADSISRDSLAKTAMIRLESGWIGGGQALWFREDEVGGVRRYKRVECATGKTSPLFDHAKLAAQIQSQTGQSVDADRLPLAQLTAVGENFTFTLDRQGWQYDPAKDVLVKAAPPGQAAGGGSRREPAGRSHDRTRTAAIVGGNVVVSADGANPVTLTEDGTAESPYLRPMWSSDDQNIVALRLHPGDRKKVYRLQLSPPNGGPSKLMEDAYDRPGDAVDQYDVVTLNARQAAKPIVSGRIEYGGPPSLRRSRDGSRFFYPMMDRGYGRWRMMSLDPKTGESTAVIDEDPATFVDSTSLITEFCQGTDEIITSSERDGWHHLYLSNTKPGGSTQITKGSWVVRGFVSMDESKRQIIFQASGVEPDEDPYFVHTYRIDFDGRNMVALNPGKGNHTTQFSPDGRFLVDTSSTVLDPQVHELRDAATGDLIKTLAKADVSQLKATGWKPPQPFSAKGRDGVTDIYGIVYRPSNFDPSKSYPVVEDIYAGPQDSFVRKSFSVTDYDQSIAELGFIVVKIDGMGTRNRSKAFHDVCYKNLKDAGFPDRILWMRALARQEPAMDLSRVGVFGTSAGGQNAAGAVLFHPDFYKVAIASCGCHDNRLDKVWWNEQWMGLMGPHYGESSNIDNAARLRGDLLLIVGELDSNVPPESTYRLAAALQKAGREFDFVVIPNADHTAGGPYGERKRRDFLVRHLLGIEPPNPNRTPPPPGTSTFF